MERKSLVKFQISEDIFAKHFLFWDKFTLTVSEDDSITGHKKEILTESTKTFKIIDVDTIYFQIKFRLWLLLILILSFLTLLFLPIIVAAIILIMIIYKVSFKEVFYSKKLIITTRNDLFSIKVAIKSEDAFKEIIDYIQSRKDEIGNKTSINSMNSNISDELVKLSELKQKGIITEVEFDLSKAKILGKI